jgi:hypothetical protein
MRSRYAALLPQLVRSIVGVVGENVRTGSFDLRVLDYLVADHTSVWRIPSSMMFRRTGGCLTRLHLSVRSHLGVQWRCPG